MPATTEFKIINTPIPGLLVIDISQIADERGYFQEKYQQAKLVTAGFPADFQPVQQNISYNKVKGTLRGIHAEPWDKYVSIITGRGFAAYVDLREANFGKIFTVELDDTKAVFVPHGVANSYQSQEDNTIYQYIVNAHWSPEGKYVGVNAADPDLNIAWPISIDRSILSEKDKNLPMLKDVKRL